VAEPRHRFAFECFGVEVEVLSDDLELIEQLPPTLPPGWRALGDAPARTRIEVLGDGMVRLHGMVVESAGDTLALVGSVLRGHLALAAPGLVFLHAGVVAHDGLAIVIPGESHSGKTTLVEELVRTGATYYSDECAVVDADGLIHPFAQPLSVREPGRLGSGSPRAVPEASIGTEPIRGRLIVFTSYRASAVCAPVVYPRGAAALALLEHTIAFRERRAEALAWPHRCCSSWRSGSPRPGRRMSEAVRFLHGLLSRVEAAEAPAPEIPEATPPREHRRICVGMATYDDAAGVWFTIQSIRLYQPEMADKLTFLILDNHPEGSAAKHLKGLESWIPSLRYVPFTGYRGTGVRDLIFREANADIVCCVDSHIFLAPGSLAAIDRYYETHPDSLDMLQGPLLSDAMEILATHFKPEWGVGMYGHWGIDERINDPDCEPFEIGMNGLGVFACRRDAWPGINSRFRAFGAEEGYLHEKVRRGGGRVLCHPQLRWLHRFIRPLGAPYGTARLDMLRNYLIGWRELGWDVEPVVGHYRELFAEIDEPAAGEEMLAAAAREAAGPLGFFDGVFCLNRDRDDARWVEARRRHRLLDADWQVERFAYDGEGRDAAIRAVVREAVRRGYEHALILDDDAELSAGTAARVQAVTAELAAGDCDVHALDGALAVHRRAYERILAAAEAADV
jgi:hypothetical protein